MENNMDANLDKIDNFVPQFKQSSLNFLQDKIKTRILAQFKSTTRKPKLNLWAKYSLPAIFILPLLGAISLYSYFSATHHNFVSFSDLFWFMSGIFGITFPLVGLLTNIGRDGSYNETEQQMNRYLTSGVSIKKYFKGYLNFENELQSYFSSFEPPLNTEKEIKQYMIDKSDKFFCRPNLTEKYVDHIFQLNTKEIEELQNADLTNFQRLFLTNKINQNKTLSFSNLQEIMQFNSIETSEHIFQKDKFKRLL